MATFRINKELNGIEISFETKPEATTIEALKTAGYRWHRVKKLWYAKRTAEREALAESIAEAGTIPAPVATVPEKINLDNLGENAPSLYGAELSKAIREDLKRRGVKGVTVRSRRVTYDTGITVTVKATEADFVSLEEYKERTPFYKFANAVERHGVYNGTKWIYSAEYESMTEEQRETLYNDFCRYEIANRHDFNEYHHERNDLPQFKAAFYEKLVAVFKIANQWNYNNSDSMTDYFDVGYYLDIDIKAPESFEIREEMTEEERTEYAAEVKAEQEREAAEMERFRAEQEERRKAAAAAEEKAKKAHALVVNNAEVIDLEESEQIYITNLAGGIGKEASADELHETIADHPIRTDALITRIVKLNGEAFEAFCELFLYDFDFLAGMGGTATEDSRVNDDNFYLMNEEQRESVKFYATKTVAIYCENELKFVVDPQGYNYARYVYEPTPESVQTTATTELEKQESEANTKPSFYFPEPVEKQIESISVGEDITVYQCDGWLLHTIEAGRGCVAAVHPGGYAQYKGFYIDFTGGGSAFIRNGRKCLIYRGIKNKLPESVTKRQINDRMQELLDANEQFTRVLKYYGEQNELPILDTVQR